MDSAKGHEGVGTAEFAKARSIADEPAFAWWVPYTLRKRDIILSKMNARIRKTTHKYGIEIPTSVENAMVIDRSNNNTLWKDALAKEMTEVGVAFEVLEEGIKAPTGWSKVTGHLVWDVKMDFTRKARWVLDGHRTPNPIGSTYAGVVSRDSIRIAFTYAALNGVDVFAADIRNAYLQAPSSQKDYIFCGSEFGIENVGKVALIRRALYGGKSAGKDFRNHLRSCMRHLDFTSCLADPDVWMRPAKRSDGSDYYEYILLYTDDALVVSENAEQILRNELGRYFTLKEESIGPPKVYLGGHVRKIKLDNGVECWAFSSSQYVQAAVKNVEEYLSKRDDINWKLPTRAETPIQTSYRPELDVSPELQPIDAAYYMSLIGVLRWIVELGRVDICLECSMLSSHLALPREGHLYQLFQCFAYLKKYHNTEMVYDPSDPVIDESEFEFKDWTSSEFGHLQGKEELPTNMPEPRGQGFVINAKVDADHASDTVTRRSRTGFIVYLNCAPVYWLSKKQTSCESSSFGSEFCAMKQCCEYLRGLRYKLRMMGIPCEGPAYIHGDNQSVLASCGIPDSVLKKKSQSIAYHFVREGAARDEWRTSYVNTHQNESDLLTKVLPAGEKRKGFVRRLLHHIYRT
ncbi:polyprotein of Ty1/Copia retrotransposon [uncultured Marinobacter sp.]|uniref:Ty1/Copia family ribonuclease HI n=1 Tax=uncultured Marinobacter sp. TaxID=187379 RepID=UPI002595FCA6|nr:polyprotein of Ty1/Copia retrotransposon [uncultured Marinobacter sp.]